MADQIQKLQDAASVLQQVDVSEIFTNLALGIAKAQEALDDNSIKQLIRLSETEVAGKSLLELGFVPAFYQFDYADVSASISIQMRLAESFSLDFQAKLDFAQNRGYSKEDIDMVEKSKSETHRKEFKSSRDVLMRAGETKSLKVQTRTVQMNHSKGSLSKVEDFEDQIREAEGVTRANTEVISEFNLASTDTRVVASMEGGYGVIYVKPEFVDDRAILKMSAYNNDAVDVNGAASAGTFNIATDFATSLGAAKTANGTGLTFGLKRGAGWYRWNGTAWESFVPSIFFEWDKHCIKPDYNGSEPATPSTPNTDADNNVADTWLPIAVIAAVLKADSTAYVTLVGHADASTTTTNDTYNLKLSEKRIKAAAGLLRSAGVSSQQIREDAKGESADNTEWQAGPTPNSPNIGKKAKWRKVEFVLGGNSDYIFFDGGVLVAPDATPATPNGNGNGFVYREASIAHGTGVIPVTTSHGSFNIAFASSASTLATNAMTAMQSQGYYAEARHDRVYLLHEKSEVHYTAYSENEEEIVMEESSSSSSSSNNSESSYVIDETVTKDYSLKKDAETIKNPSTIAVGASIDVRTARSMEVSMQGNSSMSARLRAVPPPDVFIDFIRSTFGG